jgi:hypothetical protein
MDLAKWWNTRGPILRIPGRAVEAKIARFDQHTDAFELVGGRFGSDYPD